MMAIQYEKCPVEIAVDALSGKWKVLALWYLQHETLRFNELQRRLPGVSQKVLSQQLKELEKDGIIGRQVFAEMPPRVVYFMTEKGKAMKPILSSLFTWGTTFKP
ncbi:MULTISPECIES: winged helix-turn-helix transcriptional regulator [Paenibacillus]|uniref:Transcriptional regulator n=1 Tax=Paenibacillus lutrae TaxID=2078573 RepID=A0A7X3FJ93_9BACL|nr:MULTISPECIES: helix-turn-helix domain-containing protein [Paenibacillus]MVP00597.1 transcriptional regulator [Paenibacillus lutrae]